MISIPKPIYAFVPFFPGDRTNKALPGEFIPESGSGLAWEPSWYGVGAAMDYTNDGMLQDTSMDDARFDGFSAASQIFVFKWDDLAGSDNFGYFFDHQHNFDGIGCQRFSSTDGPSFVLQTSTQRQEIRNDSANWDSGDVTLMIHRWISDAEWELSTYRLPGFEVEQERVETGAASVPGGTYTLVPGDNISIGGSNGGTVGLSGLTVYAYMMWNRALTRDQLKAVAANPRQYLRPAYVPAGKAPTVHTGTATPTLDAFTVDAVGVMHPEATGTPTVESMSLDAVAEQPFTVTGTPTLEVMTLDAIGVMQPEGTGDAVLQIIETDGAGEMPAEAVADLVMQVMTAAATGELPTTSTAILSLESIVVAVAAEVDTLVTPGVTYTIKIKESPSGRWRLTQIIFQFAQQQFWAVKLWNGFKWEDKVLLFIAP